MTTTTTGWTRRIAAGTALAAAPALIALGTATAGHAATNPGMGCETIHWGFLGSDRRQICDGPTQADGTWQRTRTFYTPAYFKPFTCTAMLSLRCTGGYPVPQSTQAQETYVVAPDTVLPDEPGWLPPGTNNIL